MTPTNNIQNASFPIAPDSLVQASVVVNPPIAGAGESEESSVIMKTLGNLTVGALGGYVTYWMHRGMIFIRFMEPNAPFSPIPNVLAGVASAAIVETAKLTHFTALKILGDRERYENEPQASFGARLRSRAWKLVSSVEYIEHKVDSLFSHLLGIRTRRQVDEEGISIINPERWEVWRREFWREAAATLSVAIPKELGISLVESFGYKVLGGHVFMVLHAITFLTHLHVRIAGVYQLQAQALANLDYDLHNNLAENSLTVDQVEDVDGFILINPSEIERDRSQMAEWPEQIEVEGENGFILVNPTELDRQADLIAV